MVKNDQNTEFPVFATFLKGVNYVIINTKPYLGNGELCKIGQNHVFTILTIFCKMSKMAKITFFTEI